MLTTIQAFVATGAGPHRVLKNLYSEQSSMQMVMKMRQLIETQETCQLKGKTKQESALPPT